MRCGNDPNAELTPGDRAVIDWFREWLRWSHLPEEERAATPEPIPPDRKAAVAARAQETVCGKRSEEAQ